MGRLTLRPPEEGRYAPDLLAAILWGALVSPRAAIPAPGIVRLAVEAMLFGGTVWMLFALDVPRLATGFGVLALVQTLAAYDRILAVLFR